MNDCFEQDVEKTRNLGLYTVYRFQLRSSQSDDFEDRHARETQMERIGVDDSP